MRIGVIGWLKQVPRSFEGSGVSGDKLAYLQSGKLSHVLLVEFLKFSELDKVDLVKPPQLPNEWRDTYLTGG